jgi:hypothetical protein
MRVVASPVRMRCRVLGARQVALLDRILDQLVISPGGLPMVVHVSIALKRDEDCAEIDRVNRLLVRDGLRELRILAVATLLDA